MRIVVALGGNALLRSRKGTSAQTSAGQRPRSPRSAGAIMSSSSRTGMVRRSVYLPCRARLDPRHPSSLSTFLAPNRKGCSGI